MYFYQAFNDAIADYAVANQRFGGPEFKPIRMTWIKPSFAWMLYRSGYGSKHNQTRVLKVKLPHEAVAKLLSQCDCKHGAGGTNGRVQWDPARDLMSRDEDNHKEPRKMLRERAIQIGVKGKLSAFYVDSVVAIQDVSSLARQVGAAHGIKNTKDRQAAIESLVPSLPVERPYLPPCSEEVLEALGIGYSM